MRWAFLAVAASCLLAFAVTPGRHHLVAKPYVDGLAASPVRQIQAAATGVRLVCPLAPGVQYFPGAVPSER